MMSFKERLARYKREARNAGIPSALIGSVPYEILWAFGVPVTPPLRQSFLGRLLVIGIPAGLIFGIAMAFVPPEAGKPPVPLWKTLGAGPAFGLLLGAFWSGMAAALKSRYNVPPWDDADPPKQLP